ncbi:MAG TPA: C-terminal binding protein [Actinomycetota bacterium]|nr:C-terminal binding protein [Actinomycetota bacterium]
MGARVVVLEPGVPAGLAEELLRGTATSVERGPERAEGEDVWALIVGPGTRLSAREFERLPSLRIVSTCSVGVDHIDLAAAEGRGVWVTNVPDYCVEEMADHALALLLALLRGVVVLDRDVGRGGWDHRAAGPLQRIRGTRLGIVGCGRIGRALAVRARALGMEVWGYDPLVPPEQLAAAGIRPADLEELLAACSALSLHAPLTPATERMIGARELALVPEGAILVNTARAGLVDQEALLAALDSGRLRAAALDVLPVEPPTPDAPAPRHPRLVVTPHAGWYSPEAEEEVYRRAVIAVRDVLEGREPRDVVVRGRIPVPRIPRSPRATP